MCRRCLFVVAGTVALFAVLGSSGPLDAQTRKPGFTAAKPKSGFVTPRPFPVRPTPKLPTPKVPAPQVPRHPKGPDWDLGKRHPWGPGWDLGKRHPWGPGWDLGKRHPKGPDWDLGKRHPWGPGWDLGKRHPKGPDGDLRKVRWGERAGERGFRGKEIRELVAAKFISAGVFLGSEVGMPGAGVLPMGGSPGLSGGFGTSGGSFDASADTAAILRAYADLIKANEEGGLLREQKKQMHLDTIQKEAELKLYLESITPSWRQKQAKIEKEILARAQTTTNPFEITSGKILNILLADLRKVGGRKVVGSSNFIDEEILGHINITTKNGNLGLLRNEGAFTWPQALTRDDVISEEDRGDIKVLTRALIRSKGNFPRNMLQDLDRFLVSAEEKLASKVNEIPVGEYLEAKRFLSNFQAARVALQNGEGAAYFKFQKWVRGGKTIQEVADYMVQEGLEFASAVAGDEAAYRSLHSALASYNVEVNSQLAGSGSAMASKASQ
jgi:hypothetical protein